MTFSISSLRVLASLGIALATSIAVASVASCVSDQSNNPVTSPDGSAGAAGQPCYANGTCDLGLTCAKPNVCIEDDGGEDAACDASTSVDEPSFSAAAASCFGRSLIYCVGLAGIGGCCDPGAESYPTFACTSTGDCGADTFCGFGTGPNANNNCAPLVEPQAGQCGVTGETAESTTGGPAIPAATCVPSSTNPSGLRLCSDNDPCPEGLTCAAIEVDNAVAGFVVGICF